MGSRRGILTRLNYPGFLMGHVSLALLVFTYLGIVVVVAIIESIGGRLGFLPVFRFGLVSATLKRPSSIDTATLRGVDRLNLDGVKYHFPLPGHVLFTYRRKGGRGIRVTHGFKGEITWADGVARAEGRMYVRFLLALPLLWIVAVIFFMSEGGAHGADGELAAMGMILMIAPLLAFYYQRREVEKELATVLDLLKDWAAGKRV